MKCSSRRHPLNVFLACLLGAGFLSAAGTEAGQPGGAFEPAPALPARELAPEALLKGPLHQVAERVQVEGYFGRFVIESKFGKFSVLGVSMLGVRVNELHAIEELQKVQKSEAFQDALKKSASAPVKFVESAVTDPGKTAENVSKGVGSVLGRIGYMARSGADKVGDTAADMTSGESKPKPRPAPAGEPEPSAFTGDPFGYNKARREWAKKLNIDPYTTNPVLRPLLDNASAASFAGSFAIDTALGAISAPVNLVVEFDTTVRDSVWNKPAIDLAKENEEKLLALGVTARTVRDFLRDRWFTPTLQTALVSALSKLGRIEGMESVIRAASEVQGETRARFFLDSVRMLVRYQEKEAKFAKIRMSNLVPVGVTRDGAPVAAVAIDYAYWDENAAAFVQRKDFGGTQRAVLVAGKASDRAKQDFDRAGLTLRSGLRP